MKNKNDDYINAFKINNDNSKGYYQKFLNEKSEQQKYLEEILGEDDGSKFKIADTACGSGTLTHHLLKKFPNADFFLSDINEGALDLAKNNLDASRNIDYRKSSIFALDYKDNSFDRVFCWQTLLALDKPEEALYELIRICKPGGKIILSSLFNIKYDVDIYTSFIDHTLESSKENIYMQYNTISEFTLKKWLSGKTTSYKLFEFIPKADFKNSLTNPRGTGSYTVNTSEKKLQLTGGMLMNWAILEITK
ncbi:MAG: methyltransferase domain-containing protein [Sphingobacteriaceae bacterium]|nr:methyltransferase domain-containing protein [Sphingobacteriaceae bacterium]